MNEIVIATKNEGKVKDFEVLLADRNIRIHSLLDFPKVKDVEETGSTFIENAVIKAEAISKQFNQVVIADDSGLVVDALNGSPGVFSARYAGPDKDDTANLNKVLEELKDIPKEKRTAHFHCALAVAIPGQASKIVEGTCSGRITEEPHGNHGFGYDPIFYIDELGKTMAQLTKEEKNKISHRKNALEKLVEVWDELFEAKE